MTDTDNNRVLGYAPPSATGQAAELLLGQPDEVAPCYVFLASDDASYMTGQCLHPNGGEIVNG